MGPRPARRHPHPDSDGPSEWTPPGSMLGPERVEHPTPRRHHPERVPIAGADARAVGPVGGTFGRCVDAAFSGTV